MAQETFINNLQQRRKVIIPVILALLLVFTLASWTSNSSPAYLTTQLSASNQQALSNASRDACAKSMNKQKTLLFDTFSEVLDGVRNIALISVPDHENKVSHILPTRFSSFTFHY